MKTSVGSQVRWWTLILIGGLLSVGGTLRGEDPVLSGPQPGEPLPALKVRGVFDEAAGKELNFVEQAGEGPILLVFLHEMTRPSIGFTRTLLNYADSRKADGLFSGLIWLDDDATAAEERLKRVRHALPKAPVGISLDGKEGPGSYGLNRQATLTILVGKEGKVTQSFALVQPSIPQDLPKVLEAIVEVAGGEAPPVSKLLADEREMRPEAARGAPASAELLGLLRTLIRKDASPEEVNKATQEIQKLVATDPVARREMERIARTLETGGRLETYGTPAAQEVLKKFAQAAADNAGDTPVKSGEKERAKDDTKKDDAKKDDAKKDDAKKDDAKKDE